ncbi:dTDP-4-dehydrorhamnose 3,5-epimerase [Pseudomonas donghuensis]|uniref:dTDP-4-dehydrorhamnose 3,5-epimerase n=1 Tax=Pseudomonas donghuensis TaxID=1163398 RepID=UPI00029B39CB|nr:dTDP-4-dehydrorhamnose 3,5-epimerase [Pseudomonas donghuensis]
MKLIRTNIPDVVVLEPSVFEDERGWFFESYSERVFHALLAESGLPVPRAFVQDNRSCSKKGVLRGLHYQRAPHQQGKLVCVTQGAAFDVAVDIRESSPTFGKWVGVELTAANKKMLWIPEGFAHGFVALEEDTHFHYKTTDYYAKECEGAIRWDDPTLAIKWPEKVDFIINQKDRDAPFLKSVQEIAE